MGCEYGHVRIGLLTRRWQVPRESALYYGYAYATLTTDSVRLRTGEGLGSKRNLPAPRVERGIFP